MYSIVKPSRQLPISQKKKGNTKVLNTCNSLKSKVKINCSKYANTKDNNNNDTLNHSQSPDMIQLQLNKSKLKMNKFKLPLHTITNRHNNSKSSNKTSSFNEKSHSPYTPSNSSRNKNKDKGIKEYIYPQNKNTNSMGLKAMTKINIKTKAKLKTSSMPKAKFEQLPLKQLNSNAIKVNTNNKQVKIKKKKKPSSVTTRNNKAIGLYTIDIDNDKQKSINTNTNNVLNLSNYKSNITTSVIKSNSTKVNVITIKQKALLVNTRLNKLPSSNTNKIHLSPSENIFYTSNITNKTSNTAKRLMPSLNTISASTNLSNDLLSITNGNNTTTHNSNANHIITGNTKSSRNSKTSCRTNNSLTNVDTINKSLLSNNNNNTSPNIKVIHSIFKISQTGFAGSNKSKVNQDNLFIHSSSLHDIEYHFIGVCDGHGNQGDLISKFIINTLPFILSKELNDKDSALSSYSSTQIHKLISNSFILTNSKLSNNTTIDTHFSGSTCISVLISNDKLYCANIGDSRALLGKLNRTTNNWDYKPLSRDHKPTEADEAKRVIRFGGRIEQYNDNDIGSLVGPMRIWLKNESIPGLAMTRSFGDQIASNVGVICEPEIRDVVLKEEDKFVILASDGLWEYISNEECIEIVSHYYSNSKDGDSAIKELYKRAFRKGIENDTVIDDITIILIFFS